MISDFLNKLRSQIQPKQQQDSSIMANDLICLDSKEKRTIVRLIRDKRLPRGEEEFATVAHLSNHEVHCGFCPQEIEDLINSC